mmetsp:Transcript_508/g.1422  ORF Transcript_508/g.1422 Transcript_508/m.1422 type:complete len:233 (-) Transcript_508:52-750(-)
MRGSVHAWRATAPRRRAHARRRRRRRPCCESGWACWASSCSSRSRSWRHRAPSVPLCATKSSFSAASCCRACAFPRPRRTCPALSPPHRIGSHRHPPRVPAQAPGPPPAPPRSAPSPLRPPPPLAPPSAPAPRLHPSLSSLLSSSAPSSFTPAPGTTWTLSEAVGAFSAPPTALIRSLVDHGRLQSPCSRTLFLCVPSLRSLASLPCGGLSQACPHGAGAAVPYRPRGPCLS